ncbi:vWA domain-containing protein [Geminocystis sp. GBBB08]|uniref:vWA domain-containing protein n=1 Tax=Geminocystis sp. GBBB08 TaxID=2604140 RepID=UPI0027E2B9CD|nr:vWA domain-containing protein [Geminocystis sp. GBBB08]MBL1208728.1 VWA domain-containing protein [Geminocystis sp. GBBB08]
MKKISVLSIITAFLTPKVSLVLLLFLTLISPISAQEKNPKKVDIVRTAVNDDQVTLRVKVTGEGDRPVMGLSYRDFALQVEGNKVEFDRKNWKSPEESEPPPAWIIVLMDMSGSMLTPDSSGKTKLEGAMEATTQFLSILAQRGGNTQVSIVPFGEGNEKCEGFKVTKQELDNFLSPNDVKLTNFLTFLASKKPCASTNLYQPLEEAIKFLGNREDTRFYLTEEQQKEGKLEPRLSIILVSDGYHNFPNEAEDFAKLLERLEDYNNVIVHTLGYGLTPQQLAKKYKLPKPATRQDVNKGKVPEEEFVDEKRLAEIAQKTGGIAEFSGDAEDIAENLQLFLNALLGEYEITYTDPNPDRGATHKVIVKALDVKSEEKLYIIPIFGRTLALNTRLLIFFSTLISLGLFGVLPFYFWGKFLKQKTFDSE